MRLDIGRFPIRDMAFGKETRYEAGILHIDRNEALDVVMEDAHIVSAELHIVKPGDPVRIVPVKEAIEMRCKIGGTAYPGVTGQLAPAGSGVVHALTGGCVLAAGKKWGSFQDGLIDMGGPFQRYTIYGSMTNLVLVADTDEEFERHEQQKRNHAIRWAGHRLAEYVGSCLQNLCPEETDVWELPPLDARGDASDLPGVVYVLQVQTQMEIPGFNTLYYGWDCNHMIPTLIHPNELLDGAVISGSFMPCSSKISSYEHCNNPTVKRLMREHGRTINFLGVILSNLNVAMDQKQRSAQVVASLSKNIGAVAAIVCEEGYGNPDVDYIQTLVELERVGIRTVGIANECTGRDGASQPLMTLDRAADALVSCGNVSEILHLPPMPTVLGDIHSLERDGISGGWDGCVAADGSVTMEDNGIFCGDHVSGFSMKTCVDY
ncbi:glycine/sarcosine/betaine reductase component B subunit [Synergistaceae bacterium OttesenSCG-928-I11]|nr:glycine/sarcosine/betaine reductase component B subunit [Synergistaceae bacterium OttesenSCG-928-I11]